MTTKMLLRCLVLPPQASRGFTENDVQILKALSSPVSVSLQRMYEQVDGEEAETS